ncbi:MAG: nuclear transport factor 2 family protein [Gemmatimonadetes bacterium]|nr:nuclear transport factor 2 family protein [Gemmatimonadota bacterium]
MATFGGVQIMQLRTEKTMTEQDVRNWLDEYGRAWVDSDPDQVVTLFAETATYRETPFDEPMRGRHEIRAYWQKYAVETHEDIEFESQVWAVRNDTAIAGWQARYTLQATGARVSLDGTFRLVFSSETGALQCTVLEEWWHRKEM